MTDTNIDGNSTETDHGNNVNSSSIQVPDSPGSIVLDLTAEELSFINGTDANTTAPGSSIYNSISIDDDTFAFFVEAGLDDPEELAMLGIDVEEIRNQRIIAERLEKQHKIDYKAALELQRQLERDRYLPPQPPTQPAAIERPPSSMSQNTIKREIEYIGNQLNKRPKIDIKGKRPITVIDDDDECIDLTDDNVASSSAPINPFYRGHDMQEIYDDDDDDEDLIYDSDDEIDYLSHVPWNQRPHNGMYPPPYSGGNGEGGDGPYNQPNFHLFGSEGFGFHHYGAHMQSIATFDRKQRYLPQIAPYNNPVLSAEETEKELRELLEHVLYDDPPAPEDRTGTPDGLKITLLEHQKIGLQWMIKMEASKNKGGILADDMGLGKVQSIRHVRSQLFKHFYIIRPFKPWLS